MVRYYCFPHFIREAPERFHNYLRQHRKLWEELGIWILVICVHKSWAGIPAGSRGRVEMWSLLKYFVMMWAVGLRWFCRGGKPGRQVCWLERSCYLWAVSHLHFLWPQSFTSPWAFQVDTEGKWVVFILTNYRHSHLYVGVRWVKHKKLRGKKNRPQPLTKSWSSNISQW